MKSIVSCSFLFSATVAVLSFGKLIRALESNLDHDIRREAEVDLPLSYHTELSDPVLSFDLSKERWNLYHDAVTTTLCLEGISSLPDVPLKGISSTYAIAVSPVSPNGNSYGLTFVGDYNLTAPQQRQCFALNPCWLWDIGYNRAHPDDGSVGRLNVQFFKSTAPTGEEDKGEHDHQVVKAKAVLTIKGTIFRDTTTVVLPSDAVGYVTAFLKCTPLLGTGKHELRPAYLNAKAHGVRMTCRAEGRQSGHILLPTTETSVAVQCQPM